MASTTDSTPFWPWIASLPLSPSRTASSYNCSFYANETLPWLTETELDDWLAESRDFIDHPSNFRLAKLTVYTAENLPETFQEIIQLYQ